VLLALELEVVLHLLHRGVGLGHARLRLLELVKPPQCLTGACHLRPRRLELDPVLV
jgi:hypothetical protein